MASMGLRWAKKAGLIFLLSMGCGTENAPDTEETLFHRTEAIEIIGESSESFITVEWMTPEGIRELYGDDVLGAAFRYPGENCIVHVPRPRNTNDLERLAILGHEVLHCWEGGFHE